MEQEDIKLIEAARSNKAAFEALYQKYTQKVYNYFWYRVGHNKEIAEDLMQQTFLKAFQHLQEFEVRDASYLTYLLKIAHNTLVNYYRVPKPIPLSLLHEIPGESSFRIHKRHDATLLWRAVRQMPEAEKNALLLKYQKELSIKEVAHIMEKSENAVKLILSRARKNLASNPRLSRSPSF